MRKLSVILSVLWVAMSASAQERFCIAKDGKTATIVVDENDWKGVLRGSYKR